MQNRTENGWRMMSGEHTHQISMFDISVCLYLLFTICIAHSAVYSVFILDFVKSFDVTQQHSFSWINYSEGKIQLRDTSHKNEIIWFYHFHNFRVLVSKIQSLDVNHNKRLV